MITRIRPTQWVALRLALLALAATFAATTISTVLRGRLMSTGARAPARSGDDVPAPAGRPLSDYLSLARRNLFATVPASDSGAPAAPVGGGSTALRLVGTGRHGAAQLAIVEDATSKRQEVVRVGDSLGGGKVVEIGWRRLVLRRADADEVITVAPEPASGAAPEAGGAKSAGPAAVAAAGPAEDQVRKIGEDRYLVSQAEVDHSLENLSDLFTQVRAVPNQEGGKTNGFKLFSIRRGSLFQKIGLENNDVVQRVNGVELTDPTRAMALFQELQGQARLTVDVLRGGETRTLSYEIR